jgi:hypothetical protein
MEARIGHLHHRYRVHGTAPRTAALAARLAADAAERLPHVLADGLAQGLADDRTVYVLRRVRAAIAVRTGGSAGGDPVRRWGERLAGAIVESVAHDPGDGENLVRFDDQSHFVASFLADLLNGAAWGRWCYGAFAALRSRESGDVARRVLLDNAAHVPRILGLLERRGMLERLLAALGPAGVADVWRRGEATSLAADATAWRPLFVHAARLLERLGARPIGDDLVDACLVAHAGHDANVWGDRAALARAILDAARVLFGRLSDAFVKRPSAPDVRAAVVALDWLDTDVLAGGLEHLLRAPDTTVLPVRRPAQATPAQRRLLDALVELAARGGVALHRDAEMPANAVRLLAALVAQVPAWADDAAVRGIIDVVVAAWTVVERTPTPDRLLRAMASGNTREVDMLSTAAPSSERTALSDLARLGDAGATAVAALHASAGESDGDADEMAVETAGAGVFLLARAVLDARLASVLLDSGCPIRFEELLATLALRWSGQLDAGTCLFAGLASDTTVEALRAAWVPLTDAELDALVAAVDATFAGATGFAGDAVPSDERDLAAVEAGQLGVPSADRAVGRVAVALVRRWTRWLKQFASSSPAYVLGQFVRRPGRVVAGETTIRVEISRRPLDLVLEMAGYTADLEEVPWLGRRRLRFDLRAA